MNAPKHLPKKHSVWKGQTNHQDYKIEVTGVRRYNSVGFTVKYDFLPRTPASYTKYEMSYSKWMHLREHGLLKENKDGLDLAIERLR